MGELTGFDWLVIVIGISAVVASYRWPGISWAENDEWSGLPDGTVSSTFRWL